MGHRCTTRPMYNCVFFQAEDGIRDYKVTGVQTCALPIFGSYAGAYSKTEYGPFTQSLGDTRFMELCEYIKKETARDSIFLFAKPRLLSLLTDQIGRASCRERV